MYAASSVPIGVVRTSVDVQERLRMQHAADGSRVPCRAKQGFGISSWRGRWSRGERLDDSWNSRFGEGRNLIMSESQSRRSFRKGSLSSRWSKKLSSLRGDSSAKDVAEDLAEDGSGSSSYTVGGSEKAKPEHLVVLVNGIWGGAANWKFAVEEFLRKLGKNVLVHRSATNSGWATHKGVDIMGNRLAEEVMKVAEENPSVTKVSFVGHSLGGLISRYAIGLLYAPPGGRSLLQIKRLEASTTESEAGGSGRDYKEAGFIAHPRATIAGLEPVNFITLASPHLGCRGNQHLPFLFGLSPLEKMAPLVSHYIIGPTGRHLFLADGVEDHPPLLQRMVTDCEEGKFLSALGCFKRRTAYANICQDRMVGWRTASIRKATEMPKPLHKPLNDKYPHIVREEDVPMANKYFSGISGSEPKEAPALDEIEERMVAGLQQVQWWRVDVSFSKARSYFEAHNLIQVKSKYWHMEGKDVIYHIIDKHFEVHKAAAQPSVNSLMSEVSLGVSEFSNNDSSKQP